MRNIITTCLFLLSLSAFAQEAGRAGELLKNEAGTKEMQTQRNIDSKRNNAGAIDNPNQANRGRVNRPKPPANHNFRWNYNHGNSEVFLRIPENGNFTVEIGDQRMSNPTGKFRFFELRSGNVPVSIFENNYLIYRTRLSVQNNTRTVLDFFSDYGLYLLGNYPLQPRWYGHDEWDDIWNNPYGKQNSNWNRNTGGSGYYGNVMSPQEFSNYIISLKRNASFDNDKRAMISSVARNTLFNSIQILELVKTMSYEDNRLAIAKELYTRCVDRQNYYLVYEAFNFSRSKRELSEYISGI